KGETAASRLMWAVGYHSDVNYLVPKVYVEGLNKTLENVRFGLRPKDTKRIDGWQWARNPFVGSRQFQGLKIMMALLNNWDLKDSNNKIADARDKKIADNELHYFVADLGRSFGKVNYSPDESRMMTQAVRRRVRELQNVENPMAAKATR